MGYRIWRKDNNVWTLAFDTIYLDQDKVNNAIAELNARYHDLIKYGELEFLPYLDHINLNRDGSIKESIQRTRRPNDRPKNRSYGRKKYSIVRKQV